MYICSMELSAHIHYLLYRHDCVTLPGFGSFLVEQKHAYYDAINQLYYPPSKVLSFNEKLQSNDGIMASHLSKVYGLSYEQAVIDAHQHIISWKENIQKQKFVLPSLGSFELNSEGKLVFSPEKGQNFLAASYALPEVLAPPISRAKINTPAYFTLENIKTRRSIRYAAVAAVFVGLLTVGSNSYLDQKANDVWMQEQALRQTARNQAATSVYDLGELPTLNINLPQEKPVQPYAPSFHIIAGSFLNETNAEKFVEILQGKGFPKAEKLVKTAKGFYQVSFASYPSVREAYNALYGASYDQYPDAWVLKK